MTRGALITGAGTGIGAATARRLAQEGFGVCLTGRRAGPIEALAKELDGIAVSADTSEPDEIDAAVAAAVDHYGQLDALVCCAGTSASGAVSRTIRDSAA